MQIYVRHSGMTIKRGLLAWLACGAGFAMAIAGAPRPTFWTFLDVLGTAYICVPESKRGA